MNENETRKPHKAVFTILTREGRRDYWLRIGTAWTNHDGSINLTLDALPLNNRLQIREWAPLQRRLDVDRGGELDHDGAVGNGGAFATAEGRL